MRKSERHAVPAILGTQHRTEAPKKPYVQALHRLQKSVGNIEALFDNFGHVRSVRTTSAQGLCAHSSKGGHKQAATACLESHEIVNALALRHAELSFSREDVLPTLGTRIEYKQVVKLPGGRRRYPVRGGFVHVFLDKDNKVFQVNSTIRHGRKPPRLASVISREQAIAVAKSGVKCVNCEEEAKARKGKQKGEVICNHYESAKAHLTFSAHKGRLEPVYEVVLTTCAPRRVFLCLVKGNSGRVVFRENKLRTMVQSAGQSGPKGKSFLRIPDPHTDVLKQIHDVVVAGLPDPKVLKNDNLIVYMGNKKKEVRAKSDGTFLYSPSDPEFSAVITFFAFHSQMELMKGWGMLAPENPIPVYVDDPDVSDNAYFDPEGYEIHLGVGSGSPFGLAKHIAYDMGVTWHENGHHIVYLQTPGNDLPGSQGGGIHESIGDVLGDLLMDFWFRHTYGKELGHTLVAKDISDDPLIIGAYASPPDGIRIQKNTKRTPGDETGEPHDDGLISGGAKADALVAMATQANTKLENRLADFGKLTLAALALVPAHKVTFVDLLEAYLSADKQLNASANEKIITDAFAAHGIKLKKASKGTKGLVPIIVTL